MRSYKKNIISLFLFLFILIQPGAQDSSSLSGLIGLSPNTMGTVGETVRLDYRALSFINIGLNLNHDIVFHHDLEFDKLGGPLLGDLYKDILSGEVLAGVKIRFSVIEVHPFLSFNLKRTKSDSLARIITVVEGSTDPYPQDTEAFVDINESELLSGFSGGTAVSLNPGALSLELRGTYSPLLVSQFEGGFFQNFGDWPNPSVNTYPESAEYWWRENSYDFEGSGNQYSLEGKFGILIAPLDLQISGFGNYRQFIYDGSTKTTNKYFYPYRLESDSDTDIIETFQTALARVDVNDRTLEAGVSIGLKFIETLFLLPGYPMIDISYVRTFRDIEFNYYDPYVGQEKWIEDYSFTRFSIYWGI